MKIVIPSFEARKKPYEIKVRRLIGSFLANPVLGIVANKVKCRGRAAKWNILVHIPGYDSTKAKVKKGEPYK